VNTEQFIWTQLLMHPSSCRNLILAFLQQHFPCELHSKPGVASKQRKGVIDIDPSTMVQESQLGYGKNTELEKPRWSTTTQAAGGGICLSGHCWSSLRHLGHVEIKGQKDLVGEPWLRIWLRRGHRLLMSTRCILNLILQTITVIFHCPGFSVTLKQK